ncbi:metal-dependent hydrolase [Carboxydocella sp. ULO1]|uniref:metal-dependent hydrolase n=1 Tax=Carboxydocella sp. ULO1 TaxID=1926599 RepID=UPI0009ADFF6D|nr:metal-dependent hydrolase [Carboxydocella sp. ULO1]GAW28691.1 metal-dependent hydrolase [Carboxydocella sp. ULO1]
MKITFLGHAGFWLTGNQTRVAIDPFLTGNPVAKHQPGEIQAEYILVSHGHGDHLGDSVAIARQSNGTIVSVFEIANYCATQGATVHPMHIGGSYNFGPVRIKLTPALHGSSSGEYPAIYLGNPCGFIVEMDGLTLYHSGDTGLFGDMALIGRRHVLDVAFIPIGDNFTMGPDDALEAVKMLTPRYVIPMHYNTWPLIAQDATSFKQRVEAETGAEVIILNPGESWEIQ